MARLTPDSVYKIKNLTVNVKKIPFGTRWKKDSAGFKKGDLYKADRLMTKGTGKILGITIHNTGNSADAETYTRATFNQNMNSSRVHFYVDALEAWQNLEENEVGWHAGTGDKSIGNDSYMAIEIIMGGKGDEKDIRAEENGALLTAHLLCKYGLTVDNVVTHKHWSGKNCPIHILPHWEKFIELVKKYQTELSQEKDKEESVLDNIPDEYAREAVQRAIDKKIIIGDSLGNLRLHSALTRQDFALILSRLGLI